jgi:hypothetical protein
MEATEDPRALNGLATRWPKGVSGNIHGRPLGTKNAFGPDYIRDFQIVWLESGIECVRQLAKKNPEAFVALAGKLVPSDVRVSIEQANSALDQTDMAILRGIKESLPAANSESPRAVLEFVRDAVRAATAKTIESTE